ncbi:helix-turn-helix domain-containing protein [Chitinophaga sp. RCC_12]|uniref:AraC family transcriptional regulator n=1 Tax=Chitinophaga sp. RCC_12 TaxID=3239226 RepID=UPI00352402EE
MKLGRGEIYKHAEFMRENGLPESPHNFGISIFNDMHLADFDNIRTNFRSDFTTILLVKKGKITGALNREEFTMSTNSLLLASPSSNKKMISIDKTAVVSVLSFTLDFLVAIGMPPAKMELYDYFTTRYSPHWRLNKEDALTISEHLNQLSVRADNLLHKAPFAKELLHHTFFLLLYELASLSTKYQEQKASNISRKESLVISFTNLVQLQFRHQRNLQQYAEQLFVTPKYLTETVKEMTGKNAGEVIDDFVMLEAKLLLDDPKLSISQVAELLHFSDQSFFGKFFKRHTGYSPKEFRAIHQ